MRKWILVMLVLTLAGCGSGPTAPEPCEEALPDISMFVGGEEQVTPCFLSEGALTYEAESTDPGVADVVTRDGRVTVFAHSPGEVTITITARNADAAATQSFDVLVPNREPEVVDYPAPVQLLPGASSTIDLSTAFSDPDGQELTYSAASRDPNAARASLTEAILTIEAFTEGQVFVDATASDGDKETSIEIDVRVLGQSTIYYDEFSTDGELNGWYLAGEDPDGAEIRVRDGYLEIWRTTDEYEAALGTKALDANHYVIETRLRATDSTNVTLATLRDHQKYAQIEVTLWSIGPIDYAIYAWNKEERSLEVWDQGNFTADKGDWVDLRFWYEDNSYRIQFDEDDPISVGDASSTTSGFGLLGVFSEHFLGAYGESQRVQVDHVKVSGAVAASDAARMTDITWRRR